MGCGVSSDHSNITNSTSSTSSMINNHSNNNINGIHHHHHQPNYHHRHNNFRKQSTQQSSLSSPVSSSATAVRSNLISNANRTSSGGVGGSIDGDGNNGDRFILNSSDDSTTNGSGDCIANGVPIVDKRNVLQLFNNLESTIQTMEETKCFEKYRIASDDGEQVKELIQNLNEKKTEFSFD